MPDTIPPDLHIYASLVGRRLRDRPDAERRAIEDDLARHLHELGHADLDTCRRELGPPEDYAVELRESLGLPAPPAPPRIRRRTVVVGAGLALGLLVALGLWSRSRPFDPPPNFSALELQDGAAWNESGTSVGNALRISIDQGGVAAIAPRYTNTSGQPLEVSGIRADLIGIDDDGRAIAPLDADYFASGPNDDHLTTDEIWPTTAEVANPGDVAVLEPRGGAGWQPFEPFVWEPGRSLQLRFGGPVIGCDSDAIRFDPAATTGAGREIMIEYAIDGRTYREPIGSYLIDFDACTSDRS